ncbi:MAG: class I SAM-dependent methyltransferase [Chloroflexi bacterium]|nr:class I SAM-dependent methyltransferase [Chloroflexota bacterium]
MSFDVAAEAYDRFMGRYSTLLSAQLADFAGVRAGQRALDVGCGPGALTGELVARLGPAAVVAVDPSEPFVRAARARHPGVDVRQAPAERMPFDDRSFDVVLAQLVVHFMSDPVGGLTEMKRISATDGLVAACVWDFGGERGPISTFWNAARSLDPTVEDESHLAGVRDGHLADLFGSAGLRGVEQTALSVSLDHPGFDSWWDPFVQGVGPAGAYAKSLDPERQGALREACRARLPDGPFTITAWAWAARGRA